MMLGSVPRFELKAVLAWLRSRGARAVKFARLKSRAEAVCLRSVMAMYDRLEDVDACAYECGLCGACSSDPGALADRYCVICGHSEIEYQAWRAELARQRAFEPDTESRAA